MNQAGDHRLPGLPTACMVIMSLALSCAAAAGPQKGIAGYVESVRIHPGGLALEAKIDTGAAHSSLDARDIQPFTRDAEPWLRFSVTNRSNQTVVIERPLHRIARIRRHAGRVQERWVVRLGICLGTVFKSAEVNLVDRAGFDYPMLIGRSFLGGDFLVDPGERFALEPSCPLASQ